jgi:hypothetical protein
VAQCAIAYVDDDDVCATLLDENLGSAPAIGSFIPREFGRLTRSTYNHHPFGFAKMRRHQASGIVG